MSPTEFKERLKEIESTMRGDEEAAHSAMDDLMCEALESLGYGEGVEVFRDQEKWYA